MQPTRPLLVARHGRLAWQFDDGTLRPYVGGAADGDDDRKFTQADLDRLIAERLARVKHEPPADYAQLQAAAAELAQLKAADQSEAQRLQAEVDKLKGDLQTAAGERDAARNDIATERRRSAVIAAAAEAKVVKPEQVFALLAKDAVTIGDDGQVTGADEAVKKFVTENPHFLVGNTPKRPVPDAGQGTRTDAPQAGSAGRAEAARRFAKAAPVPAGQQQ